MTYPKTSPKVKSSALMGFLPLCRSLNINPIEILAAEGLSSAVLRSMDLMISYNSLAHVLNHATDAAEHPLFGASLAGYQGLKTFGPLGLLASQSQSVAGSLDIIQKYFHFHAEGVNINLQPHGKDTHLGLEIMTDPSISQEQVLELSLVFGYRILTELSPEFADQTQIHFRHAPLAPLEQYQALTPAKLCFEQEKDALVFPSRLLDCKPKPASEEVKNYLETFLERESKGQQQPLQYKVSKLIYELIPSGEATLTTIAPMLGLNVRTLQRELSLAGTEFRTLLDEVRFEIARTSLEQNSPITDVALNLGYSELSAFSRAFKRWSGVPPQQWRQSHYQALH
ncbi:AraC family transcriptional regulator ligand-binding domain-containing protein [Marinobacterium sp. YM272]|uniref:AraC family transcriptional regulator n=1 Tax=Marinobacterium sp. YM272 TaxID=3421654 RepID=UPI003D7F7F26